MSDDTMNNDRRSGDTPAVLMRFRTIEEFFHLIDGVRDRMMPNAHLVAAANQMFDGAGLETRINPETQELELHERLDEPGTGSPQPPPLPSLPGLSGGPAGGGGGGGSGGGAQTAPAATTDPAQRQRMRTAAAEAHEKLAEARTNGTGKPAEGTDAAKPVAGAAKPRGRRAASQEAQQQAAAPPAAEPPAPSAKATSEDLAGDAEVGERTSDEAAMNEPTDYSALDPKPDAARAVGETEAKVVTPIEMRTALIDCLRVVHDIARPDVEGLVVVFGVKKLSAIPEGRVAELWTHTEALCAKHHVPFPPAGMAAP